MSLELIAANLAACESSLGELFDSFKAGKKVSRTAQDFAERLQDRENREKRRIIHLACLARRKRTPK